MYKITEKVALNPTVTKMVIEAPAHRQKGKAGPVHHFARKRVWRADSADHCRL